MPSPSVQADIVGGLRSPDSRSHYDASVESTDSHHDIIDPIFPPAMQSLDHLTVMWDIKRARHDAPSWIDVYWYATAQSGFSFTTTNADSLCNHAIPSTVCDQVSVQFEDQRGRRLEDVLADAELTDR